jgi:hypothetical protein
VQFTIATDGPEMMRTHLRDEFELLLRIGAADESELSEANRCGQGQAGAGRASFVASAQHCKWPSSKRACLREGPRDAPEPPEP